MRVRKRKATRRHVRFYRLHAGAFPPYKVLMDGSFAATLVNKSLGSPSEVCERLLESPCRIFVTGCVLRELRRLRAEERRDGKASGTITNEYGRLVSECAKEHCLKCVYASDETPKMAGGSGKDIGDNDAEGDATQEDADGDGGKDHLARADEREEPVPEDDESDEGEEDEEDDEEDDDDDGGGGEGIAPRVDAGTERLDNDDKDQRRRERQRRRKRERRLRLREEREEKERQNHVSGAACILGRVESAMAHLRADGQGATSDGTGRIGRCIGSGAGTSAKEVFFVATQDRQLKALLRLVPGVPIITITAAGHVILEEPSPEQLEVASRSESSRRGVSQQEGEMLQKMKKRGRALSVAAGDGAARGDADDDDEYSKYYNRSSVQFKRNGAKGPNPLSAKKKKKKLPVAGQSSVADAAPERRKRPRRKGKHNREEAQGV